MRNPKHLLRTLDEVSSRVCAAWGWPATIQGSCTAQKDKTSSDRPASVLAAHEACPPEHINHSSLRDTLELLGGKPAVILETGSSAWGTNSTCLWDKYVQRFGGKVWSVDIRRQPSRELRYKVSSATTLVTDDSVRFLSNWTRNQRKTHVSLVYLDSWDLDASSPISSALHCVREYNAISPLMRNGALLLVDDTPHCAEWLTSAISSNANNYQTVHGLWPGKGMLLDLLLSKHPQVTKIHHRYQTLYRFS
jgi:hypothetical protein